MARVNSPMVGTFCPRESETGFRQIVDAKVVCAGPALAACLAAVGRVQWCAIKRLRIMKSFFACLAASLVMGLPQSASAQSHWEIVTIAGTGQKGYSGDGGPAAKAQLNNPYGLTRGPDGALYVCDIGNHCIRKIMRDGRISTAVGTGQKGNSGDGGPATKAEVDEPYEVRFDHAGNLFFVDMKNAVVRRVDLRTGVIATVAGTGQAGFAGDGGPATKAQLKTPHSIGLDSHGGLYICDIGNQRIRQVDLKSGVITTFAGTGQKAPTPDGAKIAGTPLNGPRAIDFDQAGNLWVALREGNQVFRLDFKAGIIRHVAGTGKKGFTGNGGPARQATLSGPKGISVAPDGNIYLADTESHSIRMINVKTGKLELIAGTGKRGDGPTGNPFKCQMSRPHGVFVDADGTVYVGDSEANQVRAIRRVK